MDLSNLIAELTNAVWAIAIDIWTNLFQSILNAIFAPFFGFNG